MLEVRDKRPEWECGLGFSDWKTSLHPTSPHPLLLAQPFQEQETLCTWDSLPSDP